MPKSTPRHRRRKAGSDRPAKPYKGSLLYAHPAGSWAKKIRGTFHDFGLLVVDARVG